MKAYTDNPLVSVIVPNYNHEMFLADRLSSVLNQTFQDFELIVLDDASRDNSILLIKSILQDYPYRFFVNKSNSGSPCSQWQKGIEMASADLIWIAESDDDADLTFLERMICHFTPEVSLVYCRTVEIDSLGAISNDFFWPDLIDSQRWHRDFISPALAEMQDYMTKRNTVPNASCAVFRQSCFREMPNLNQFRFCGDWVFWASLLAQSSQSVVVFLASPLVMHRAHEHTTRQLTNSSRTEVRRLNEHSMAINRVLQMSGLSWFSILMLCLGDQWDWRYCDYIVQRHFAPGSWRGQSPFKGIHYVGYLLYLLKARLKLKNLGLSCRTRKAVFMHQLKSRIPWSTIE